MSSGLHHSFLSLSSESEFGPSNPPRFLVSNWTDPFVHVMGILTIPERMVWDHLVYKYRVKRVDDYLDDLSSTYEELDYAEQNRVLYLGRFAHSMMVGEKKRYLHYDDMIYPQQNTGFLKRWGQKLLFARPTLGNLAQTYALSILAALRSENSIRSVRWRMSALISSFKERQQLSMNYAPIKPKSTDLARQDCLDALFETAQRFV